MNCSEFTAQLHAYFRGELSADRMARLEAHSAGCGECGDLMARAKELSCREFTEFLNAYVEGELPPDRKRTFERHLEICGDCRNYLQSYRQTMRLSALALGDEERLPPGPVPEDLILAVLRALPKKQG